MQDLKVAYINGSPDTVKAAEWSRAGDLINFFDDEGNVVASAQAKNVKSITRIDGDEGSPGAKPMFGFA
jgi:hypothetical protein